MTAAAVSAIVLAASLVVLGAVVMSARGPLSSLRRSIGRFVEVREEAERLRRGLDVA